MPLKEMVVALGPPAITGLAAIAGFWVQSRFGRVKAKDGDIEVEARTSEEVRQLLKHLRDVRGSKSKEEA